MLPLAANELVDVIDAAGNVVAVVTRREMRQRRLPHRCTYVLVFNSRGELFVHLRTPIKDVYPSHWDVCIGGVLAAGEDFDAGVVREIREELGVEPAGVERLFPFAYEDERTVVQGMVYRLAHDGPFRLQSEEIVRGEFVPVAEVWRRALGEPSRVSGRVEPAKTASHPQTSEPFCPDGLAVLRQAGFSPAAALLS